MKCGNVKIDRCMEKAGRGVKRKRDARPFSNEISLKGTELLIVVLC